MPIVMNGGAGSNRGFTLVEMSIVLVIIGLIIGGILKGQEIIASARQKAVINQVNAIRSASSTYFDRYRALPGDDSSGSAVDSNIADGDGDGLIGPSTDATTASDIAEATGQNEGEAYQFFNAMIAANLLNGGQVTSGSSGATFGKTALPASPITGAGLTLAYGSHPGGGTGGAKVSHWIRVHRNAATPASAVSPRTMLNIDTQTDDGQAGNGSVRGSAGSCDGGTLYSAGDDIQCVGLFALD